MKKIKTGSDFSGVGAFDFAIERVAQAKGFQHERVYACDWDKFARITYAHNHGEPKYYPHDVYEREIPEDSLDLYMTSPPCQTFSIAGNRKGKEDQRGILFFNSYEFIKKNQPRFFIFENVKGLISHDNGKTFQEWVNYLGGKSVNGLPILFKDENAVDYHIYWKVLNSKNYGVPQNRERVFIVGIRDDIDNNFNWPKEEYLTTKLKDVLEQSVDEKYFLSDKAVSWIIQHREKRDSKNKFPLDQSDVGSCVTARYHKCGAEDPYVYIPKRERTPEQKEERRRTGTRFKEEGISPTLSINKGEGIKCCIPVLTPDREKKRQEGRRFKQDGDPSFTVTTQDRHGVYDGYNIRRLTPRECFRLQDFPEEFDFSVVSDTQAYKQAGNSITVRVLEKIILKLKL